MIRRNIILQSATSIFFLLLTHLLFGQVERYNPDRVFDPDSLKDDLRVLKSRMETMHAGLYRYSSKACLDHFFDSLQQAISHPMLEPQFLNVLTLLNSKIKNAHTMFLPSDAATEYNNTQGRFLPFSVMYLQGKLYVVENNSSDSAIAAGTEILSINGVSVNEIMLQLISRQVRDGYNQTYPVWILNHYFSAYYSFTFGQPNRFTIEFKPAGGDSYKKTVQSLPKDSIAYFRRFRYGVDSPGTNEGKGIFMEKNNNKRAAILSIRSFDPEILLSFYKQDYKRAMDSLFIVLKREKTANLILDLRDNQGGDFSPARYLLSFLLSKPVRFLVKGKESRLIIPQPSHFGGKLFVLINGGSFSATGMVAAILESSKRAVFIGEEAGGNKFVISGDPEETVLPHTKIRCFISTTTYHITEGINNGHGVLPTHAICPTIEDIRTKRDPSLQMALGLIGSASPAPSQPL